jgi:HlyD family secretion protein
VTGRVRWAAAILLAAAAVAGATARWWPAAAEAQPIPTARVQRGRVEVTIHATGEVRAARTTQMFTPATGGQLQIVALAESGAAVKAGDAIVEFDAAEQQFNLEQARFDLQQAEQEIVKADAAAAVQAADDDVALLHARFDVRRAELDASANELVGALQARENTILLQEARAKLAELEHEVAVKRESSRAAGAELFAKRDKARIAVQTAERLIDLLKIRAPFDGYVTRRQNFQAFGGIVFSLAALPEYRVGDVAFGGQVIADLIDASHVEASAKVTEQDRANIAVGQAVDVAVDGTPAAKLHGTVRAVSAVASRQLFDAGNRQFDVTFDLAGTDVRPGVTGDITVHGPAFDNVLYVPRAAVFEIADKSTVFVRNGASFEPQPVRVRTLTESVAVVENVDPAREVALVNPTASGRARPGSRPPSPVSQRAAR